MQKAVVIQARTGSTRLPGKVLLTVGDRTLLELCSRRAGRARHVQQVIIATTDQSEDDAVASEAARLGYPCVRGSERDVLSRYHLAAKTHGIDVVCRITSDCPLIDPAIIDAVFDLYLRGGYDYASNTLRRTFPRGLDCEVFSRQALDRAQEEASLPLEREHVTPYLYHHPELFSLGSFEGEEDLSSYRWTVDEPADLRFVREVVARLGDRLEHAGYGEILTLLRAEPDLQAINAWVEQKKL